MKSIEEEIEGRGADPGFEAGVVWIIPERSVGWGVDTDAFRSAGLREEGA